MCATGDEAAHDPDAGGEEGGAASAYQFLHSDEQRREGDTQALAPATEEQAAGLKEGLNLHQDQEEGEKEEQEAAAAAAQEDEEAGGQGDAAGQQGDEAQGAGDAADPVAGTAPRKWGGGGRSSAQAPKASKPAQQQQQQEGGEEQQEDEEERLRQQEQAEREEEERRRAALLESLGAAAAAAGGDDEGRDAVPEVVLQRGGDGGEGQQMEDDALAHAGEVLSGEEAPAVGLLSEEDAEALRRQLDERLRAAAAAGGALADGGDAEEAAAALRYGAEVWSRCEALTSGLASELAEQLRLILEPTLASRMAGDFKTGKRINMKKVIAYIASHFRKDKIWMRRSRPDKRRYQVLLAVDDSRSMAENGCGGVALESLALLCKAMSRLEVGQVGVLKFGGADGVVPLQPLDAPLSDAVGARLAASLRFTGDSTIADAPVQQLLAGLGHMLDTARHAAGAGGIGASTGDLSQLVLILADGRFHERESLRAAVRDLASRPGVCLAFLALDPPSAAAQGGGASGGGGGSLLDMQSVSFQGGKPVFTKYLDAFPFPYYVLLRDAAALPRTLADLLRQWFTLSAT